MANITKMFVHYNHTKAEFIAAGLESTYANSIVFISGADKEAPCIYTHNNYFANVQDALDAIASLSYIKGRYRPYPYGTSLQRIPLSSYEVACSSRFYQRS